MCAIIPIATNLLLSIQKQRRMTMSKFCIYCGEQLAVDANFCSSCGKKQVIATDSPSENTESAYIATETIDAPTSEIFSHPTEPTSTPCDDAPKKAKKKFSVTAIIRNSILLAVAIILFAMSFAPIIKLEDKEYSVEMSITAIDEIGFLFDSMKMLDEEDLKDSVLYEQIEDLRDKLLDEIEENGETTEKATRLISKITLLLYRLGLQSEDYKTSLTEVLPAVVSLVYMLLTLAFLVFASLNFATSFNCLANAKEKLYSYTIKFLAAIPGFVLVLYSTIFLFMGNKFAFMAWGATASLVISLLTIITITVLAFIFKWHKNKFNIPLRAIAAVASILVICMTLTPFMISSIKGTFDGRSSKSTAEIPVYSSFFDEFKFTEDDWEYIEELRDYKNAVIIDEIDDMFEEFEDYSKSEINNGAADYYNATFIKTNLVIDTADFALEAMAFIPFFYFAAAIFASMILQQTLRCFMDGTYSYAQILVGKIAGLVTACVTLGLIIATFAGVALALQSYAPSAYGIAFGAGTVFLVIFAILNCTLPSKKKK